MNKYQKWTLEAFNAVFVAIMVYHAVVNGDWSHSQNAFWFVVVVTTFSQVVNYCTGPAEHRTALGKAIGGLIPLAITWWFGATYGYPRVFSLCIGSMIAFALVTILLIHLPKPMWMQRLYYKRWKRKMVKLAMPGQPTASLAFIIFVTVELDKHFEAGGMAAARQAVLDWFDAIKN
jgi:hypothetical protein